MSEINYFWDEIEDNVVREYDDSNNTLAQYTTEPTLYGSVLSQDRGGKKRCFQFDGQGNTTELTDGSGTLTDMRRYSAFGETTASSGDTATPFGFGGRWGYHSNRSESHATIRRRILPLANGRWASPDPKERVDRSESWYVYAANRPLDRTDPSGLIAVGDECDNAEKRWPRKDGLACQPSSDVGIQHPGPCKMLIVIGHNYPKQYKQLQAWLTEAIVPHDCTGCGHWFGAVACCSRHLHNQFPEAAIIPGLAGTTKFIGCNEMVDRVMATMQHVDALAKRLCENRMRFVDSGCPGNYSCGADFAFCTSVEIQVKCDASAFELFHGNECPPPEDSPPNTKGSPYSGGKDLSPLRELCASNKTKRWSLTTCPRPT